MRLSRAKGIAAPATMMAPIGHQTNAKGTNKNMAQVELNAPAPDFSLVDYEGNEVSLSQFKEKQHVLLVFNRGFT